VVKDPARSQPIILIVDDERANLVALESMLAPSGALIVRAATGSQALETAATFSLALVILDDRLPDMRGLDVALTLRARYGDETPPILLHTSGDPGRERRREWHRAGILDVYWKPVDPDILRSKVAILLQLRRRRS
jgi:CheY-like chemotaxis protein